MFFPMHASPRGSGQSGRGNNRSLLPFLPLAAVAARALSRYRECQGSVGICGDWKEVNGRSSLEMAPLTTGKNESL